MLQTLATVLIILVSVGFISGLLAWTQKIENEWDDEF